MENSKTSVTERLDRATNVLVTVPSNPSVDQLAAAIGMTLFLNKLGKRATAVFSGEIPSTLEFLKPEETIEKNTDSLRDFIIALDKSKADKLRYKVEDKLVKIFITPYRTSLSQDDLEFSQGDFNVDVILALGVHEQRELDQAITAHGRILHDATIVTLNTKDGSQLGTLSWVNPTASSLCEMAAEICETTKKDTFDAQMATAFLTGIVAETERFSNNRTTSSVMNMSARLMSAGANQQLVATRLEEGILKDQVTAAEQKPEPADGSLEIEHQEEVRAEPTIDEPDAITNDVSQKKPEAEADIPNDNKGEGEKANRLITEPPTLGGTLTASGKDVLEPSTDPLSLLAVEGHLLSHDSPSAASSTDEEGLSADSDPVDIVDSPDQALPATLPDDNMEDKTLVELEKSVNIAESSEPAPVANTVDAELEAARKAVEQATAAAPVNPLPTSDTNVSKIAETKAPDLAVSNPSSVAEEPAEDYLDVTKLDVNTGLQLPSDNQMPKDPTAPTIDNPGAPPPVPPPLMPEPLSQRMPTHGQQPLPNSEDDNTAPDMRAPL